MGFRNVLVAKSGSVEECEWRSVMKKAYESHGMADRLYFWTTDAGDCGCARQYAFA